MTAPSSPVRTKFARPFWCASRWPGGMIRSASSWPTASAAVKPNVRSAAGLNWTMWPAASIRITQSSATSRIASLRAWLFRRGGLGQLACAHFVFERGRTIRGVAHLDRAALTRHDEKDVLEDHPCRVLEPAPLAGDEYAVDRLRPEHAAQHVIECDDDRRREPARASRDKWRETPASRTRGSASRCARR